MQTILFLSRISEIERVFMKTIYRVLFCILISMNSFAGSTLVLSNFTNLKKNPELKSNPLNVPSKIGNIQMIEAASVMAVAAQLHHN